MFHRSIFHTDWYLTDFPFAVDASEAGMGKLIETSDQPPSRIASMVPDQLPAGRGQRASKPSLSALRAGSSPAPRPARPAIDGGQPGPGSRSRQRADRTLAWSNARPDSSIGGHAHLTVGETGPVWSNCGPAMANSVSIPIEPAPGWFSSMIHAWWSIRIAASDHQTLEMSRWRDTSGRGNEIHQVDVILLYSPDIADRYPRRLARYPLESPVRHRQIRRPWIPAWT